jgi:hypothetical protein
MHVVGRRHDDHDVDIVHHRPRRVLHDRVDDDGCAHDHRHHDPNDHHHHDRNDHHHDPSRLDDDRGRGGPTDR